MIIDTKFTVGDTVHFMLGNRIEGGTIKEIEIHISPKYGITPTIIYVLDNGVQLNTPSILCTSRQEVADELLKQD